MTITGQALLRRSEERTSTANEADEWYEGQTPFREVSRHAVATGWSVWELRKPQRLPCHVIRRRHHPSLLPACEEERRNRWENAWKCQSMPYSSPTGTRSFWLHAVQARMPVFAISRSRQKCRMAWRSLSCLVKVRQCSQKRSATYGRRQSRRVCFLPQNQHLYGCDGEQNFPAQLTYLDGMSRVERLLIVLMPCPGFCSWSTAQTTFCL